MHSNSLDKSILRFFGAALKIALHEPRYAGFLLRNLFRQRENAARRRRFRKRGVQTPAFMIMSITRNCNLRCSGCYAATDRPRQNGELSAEQWASVIGQAQKLGVSSILLAGGEPLTRPEIIHLAGRHQSIIFPLFTNGLLLDAAMAKTLRRYKNIVPIISIEGSEQDTNTRRGSGVFAKTLEAMAALKKQHIIFGVSFTVTAETWPHISSPEYIEHLYSQGARVFFFVEYIPVDPEAEHSVITQEQREAIPLLMQQLRKEFAALFIAFPGDEEKFGGCLAAGRGFVHISAEGNLEPCPFAPFSDTCITTIPLEEALHSAFLAAIRAHPEHLSETKYGCALFENAGLVQSLLQAENKEATQGSAKE